jgi:hypothetical protein
MSNSNKSSTSVKESSITISTLKEKEPDNAITLEIDAETKIDKTNGKETIPSGLPKLFREYNKKSVLKLPKNTSYKSNSSVDANASRSITSLLGSTIDSNYLKTNQTPISKKSKSLTNIQISPNKSTTNIQSVKLSATPKLKTKSTSYNAIIPSSSKKSSSLKSQSSNKNVIKTIPKTVVLSTNKQATTQDADASLFDRLKKAFTITKGKNGTVSKKLTSPVVRKSPTSVRKATSLVRKSASPIRKETSQVVKKSATPIRKSPTSIRKATSPSVRKSVSPIRKATTPKKVIVTSASKIQSPKSTVKLTSKKSSPKGILSRIKKLVFKPKNKSQKVSILSPKSVTKKVSFVSPRKSRSYKPSSLKTTEFLSSSTPRSSSYTSSSYSPKKRQTKKHHRRSRRTTHTVKRPVSSSSSISTPITSSTIYVPRSTKSVKRHKRESRKSKRKQSKALLGLERIAKKLIEKPKSRKSSSRSKLEKKHRKHTSKTYTKKVKIQRKGKKPSFMDIVFRQAKSPKKEYVYEYERKQTAKKSKSKEIKLSELQKLAKKYGVSKTGTKKEVAHNLLKKRRYDLNKSEKEAIKKLLNVTESKPQRKTEKKSKKISSKKRTYKKKGLKLKELQKLAKKYGVGKNGSKTDIARKLIKRRKYDLKKSEYSALKKLI